MASVRQDEQAGPWNSVSQGLKAWKSVSEGLNAWKSLRD